jgi:hypothetical protein
MDLRKDFWQMIYMEKGASSPFTQAKRTDFPSPLQRGCKTLLHRENFTAMFAK